MLSIIFDLDGTLINSIPGHRKLIQEVAQTHGFTITEEEFSAGNGMTPEDGLRQIMKQRHLQVDVEQYLKDREDKIKQIYELITLYPDTISTLEKLSSHTLAVATSSEKEYLDTILKQFSMENYFAVKLSANDVNKAKPSPEIFLQAAKKLVKKPSECIVIEDSVNGIIAGNRAGMKTVCVLSTTPQSWFVEEAKPDWFIHTLSELPELLERIQANL